MITEQTFFLLFIKYQKCIVPHIIYLFFYRFKQQNDVTNYWPILHTLWQHFPMNTKMLLCRLKHLNVYRRGNGFVTLHDLTVPMHQCWLKEVSGMGIHKIAIMLCTMFLVKKKKVFFFGVNSIFCQKTRTLLKQFLCTTWPWGLTDTDIWDKSCSSGNCCVCLCI